MPEDAQSEEPLFGVSQLKPQALRIYAHLWQFENWLRCLVYVQLRARDGDDWQKDLQISKAKVPKEGDKRMTHMPTPEDDILSFVPISELKRVIAENWSLFESYLPPKDIWGAKFEEVMAIRHRIAHFRSLHQHDAARVLQFLRDIDQGFWRFCTAYNNAQPVLPQSDDPVVSHFLEHDLFAWTKVDGSKWARIGHAAPSERFAVTVEVLPMPWATWSMPIAGQPGFLYDVMIYARGQRHLDYRSILRTTLNLHPHIVHLCLDGGAKPFRFTVPACLGKDKVISIIEGFFDAAQNSLRPGLEDVSNGPAQRLADSFPEYVLGPENPLTFLSPDMPCDFFQGIHD